MLKRIIPFAHSIIEDYIRKDDSVIDATCGNGHDTLFLATLANHVYSYDIQASAIESTTLLLNKHQINNVTLINESHESFHSVTINPKVIMYNLGYLPGSDKTVTTTHSTTISSIKNGLEILEVNGLISITVYTGHTEGLKEDKEITTFVQSLSSKFFNVILYKAVNKANSPYNIFIEKIR